MVSVPTFQSVHPEFDSCVELVLPFVFLINLNYFQIIQIVCSPGSKIQTLHYRAMYM